MNESTPTPPTPNPNPVRTLSRARILWMVQTAILAAILLVLVDLVGRDEVDAPAVGRPLPRADARRLRGRCAAMDDVRGARTGGSGASAHQAVMGSLVAGRWSLVAVAVTVTVTGVDRVES